ncbi:adenylate kinase [Thermoplasmatales archaeon SG8-52-1]|nr:MAG: adenylate kinase [Thermoplasmatales archaeon SG8-52-1]
MVVIVVTGIPGVGKTTVMQKAAEGMDIKFVTFGTIMEEIAKDLGLVKERDEMRKLTLEQQKDLQIKSAKKIASMGNVILDTHCTIKTPKGYMPGLPEWVIKKLNPTAIVVVEADPEEIFNRRANDPTRNRDPDTKEQINEHQMINRAAAMAYAALSGSTVKIVFNHDNAIDAAVEQAAPVLK